MAQRHGGCGAEEVCLLCVAEERNDVKDSCCPRLLFKLPLPQRGLLIHKHGERKRLFEAFKGS